LIKETGCNFLIHGHTHRQNFHTEQLGDLNWKRWVLSDWDFDHPETVLPKGNALSITHEGMAILDLVRN
jgi:UDP-2,3-diacylglucosamine hydrolase